VAHDELAPLSSDQDPISELPPIEVEHGLSVPVIRLLFVLLWVTLGALTLAWLWPEETVMHFWLVAQFVPVFYVVLLWYATRRGWGRS
jgi:Flp pilus assembly protein TadB